MAYKAVIAGASGLIGGHLLNILLESKEYEEVLALVRSELPVQHKKLVQLIIDFDKPEQYDHAVTGHAVFSCLGTIRSKTPDLTEYRKIDHDYAVRLAEIAKTNSVAQFHLVSSIGANKSSSNFYTKMKGDTEEDVQKVGMPTLHIYRPSVLGGDRGKQNRPMERLLVGAMKLFKPVMIGGLRKYRVIEGRQVAYAMFKKSLEKESGVFVHQSDKIQEIK